MSITSLIARFSRADSTESVMEFNGRHVPVVLVRSPRARRAALRVDSTRGEIRLTLPTRTAAAEGRRLIEANRAWIADRVARLPRPHPLAPGGTLPFQGEELLIEWQADAPRTPALSPDQTRLTLGGPADAVSTRIERWLRAEALRTLTDETRYFAEAAGRTVEGVRIGDPRGRWGSCSSRSRIAYSWRLILAPSWVRRSVVAHEVAHLVHLNHSPAFHALHRQLLGEDPAPARQWLAAHGPGLYWVGRER